MTIAFVFGDDAESFTGEGEVVVVGRLSVNVWVDVMTVTGGVDVDVWVSISPKIVDWLKMRCSITVNGPVVCSRMLESSSALSVNDPIVAKTTFKVPVNAPWVCIRGLGSKGERVYVWRVK